MLTQAIRFLSAPPGDLVYHLVVLFAIEAIVWMTWRHRHAGRARRWALAAWGLSAGRVSVVLVAALVAYKVIPSSTAIMPPLERFVEVVSLGFLLWAFVPLFEAHSRMGQMFAIGNLCLSAVFYAWAAPQWYMASRQGIAFNTTLPDIVWGMWALTLSLLGVITTLGRRQNEWAMNLVAFGLMALGHGLHVFAPDPQLHSAEWSRLTALAAYPLFAALVYRQIEALQLPLSFELAQPAADLWPVAEACRAIAENSDLARALDQAASAIAKAIRADLVAIGLPGESPDTVHIATIHPSASPTLGASASLDAHPVIRQAITMKSTVTCELGGDAAALAEWLGATPRPWLIEPLVYDRETIGVLIASEAERGLPSSNSRVFARAAHAAADQLASALGSARKTDTLARRADQVAAALRDEQTRAAQSRATLEAQLARAQADMQATQVQLEDAQEQAARHQKRATEIAALVDLQMNTPANWPAQARQLNAARAQAITEAQALKQQIEELMQHQAELENELARAKELPSEPIELPEQVQTNGAHLGVLVGDSNGQIVAVSGTAAQLLGYSRSALIGKSMHGLCADPAWSETIQATLHPNGSHAPEAPVHFATHTTCGSLDVELTTLSATPFASGGVVAVIGGVNGVGSEPDHREVIASLAQELRTPMTSITGYTDLLLSESAGILGAMQRQFLQRVRANIERMNGMLNDLIRVTAVDTQRLALEPEPINLIKIIEEAIMGSSAQFRERNISIQLDLAERLLSVHADRDSLYQIMSHLLANACLCSKPGTDVIVSAQLTKDDEHVSVSITDTGGGIRPSDQLRVFARRYRADNPLIEGLGDTGIGLSIAKTLVEAHGGRIWVNSELGKGSTFTFILRTVQSSDTNQ